MRLRGVTEVSRSNGIGECNSLTNGENTNINKMPENVKSKYHLKIVWINVVQYVFLHSVGLYGFYLFMFTCMWKTCLWTFVYGYIALLGICAGVHRLWSHRCYKAKLPLKIILMIFQTMAGQNDIYSWARNHRVHHKFTDTDADPHNSTRGVFFSHVGWIMVRKLPDVINKGKTIDISDLEKDQVVQFQRRYYSILAPTIGFLLPAIIPWYFWNENAWTAWIITFFRYCVTLNLTFLINSAGHMWGTKPYDKAIAPADHSLTAFLTLGEGWHNYHHVFPWDYKTGELSSWSTSQSTVFIDLCAKIGWAYDLKTVPIEMVQKRAKRTGDGSRFKADSDSCSSKLSVNDHDLIWGWGDTDMKSEDIRQVTVHNQLNHGHD